MKKGRLGRLLLAIATVAFASALAVPAMAWADDPDESTPYKVSNVEALAEAIGSGQTNLLLSEGEYTMPAAAKGKTLTITGADKEKTIIKVVGADQGEANGQLDYNLDGSNVAFNNLTIETNNATYAGFARLTAKYYDCIFEQHYSLQRDSEFYNCVFNVTGDQYNIWTWGAPNVKFDGCTFNSDGKALMLYGTANTTLTVSNCVFNDNGRLTEPKAAIEIGNDYNKSYTLVVRNTTVNGYDENPNGEPTGTNLWANKNEMKKDKLNVIVDGKAVYSDYVAMIGSTGYVSLKDALEEADEATDKVTVEILAEIVEDLSAVKIPEGVTINGNGNTVTTTGTTHYGHDCMFYSEGDCTVRNLTVAAQSVWNDQSTQAFDFRNGGALENVAVEEGFFAGVLVGGQNVGAKDCIFNTKWGIYSDSGAVGKATITGCTFNGERAAMLYCPADFTGNIVNSPKGVSAANEEIVVSGNEFNGDRAVSFNTACKFEKNALSSGTIIEIAPDLNVDASYNFWGGSAPAENQAGGASILNYYADEGLTILVWNDEGAFAENNNGKPVTEGTFGFDPSKYLAPGYYASKNDDGTWTVRVIPYIPPAESACGDDAACNVFGDVDADAWYHEVIDWAYANGVLRGYDDGSGNVGPGDVTMRTHVAVMMWRMAGEPAASSDPGFADVKQGAWYYDAVAWAKEAGLIVGYQDGSGLFGVADPMTREQMATVLYRFAQMLGCDVSVGEDTNILSYLDCDEISEWAIPALQWAVGAGIVSGYTEDGEPTGYLGPKDDAERAHFAAMLMRLDDAYGIL